MVSLLSVPLSSDNSFCHIVSPYSIIVDSSQKLCKFERSKVENDYCQKKMKLIINSNTIAMITVFDKTDHLP